jgi:hypothetical protein
MATKQFSFHGLVTNVLAGKKVTRLLWQNADNYVYLNSDTRLCLFTDKEHLWTVSREYLEAKDWMVLDG